MTWPFWILQMYTKCNNIFIWGQRQRNFTAIMLQIIGLKQPQTASEVEIAAAVSQSSKIPEKVPWLLLLIVVHVQPSVQLKSNVDFQFTASFFNALFFGFSPLLKHKLHFLSNNWKRAANFPVASVVFVPKKPWHFWFHRYSSIITNKYIQIVCIQYVYPLCFVILE